MPTTAFGAPAAATPASTAGVSAFARPTTADERDEQQRGAEQGVRPEGGGACVLARPRFDGRK